jgi:hypothetical protein
LIDCVRLFTLQQIAFMKHFNYQAQRIPTYSHSSKVFAAVLSVPDYTAEKTFGE